MIRPTPSVAMKPFTRSLVTMSPFASPITAATASVSRTAGQDVAGLPAMTPAAMRLAGW